MSITTVALVALSRVTPSILSQDMDMDDDEPISRRRGRPRGSKTLNGNDLCSLFRSAVTRPFGATADEEPLTSTG